MADVEDPSRARKCSTGTSVLVAYSAIDSEVRSADVVAQEDCLVASLPAEAFRDVLCDRPKVAMATVNLLTRQTQILTDRAFEFSALGAKNRLHAELLRLPASTCGTTTPQPYCHFPRTLISPIVSRSTTRRALAR